MFPYSHVKTCMLALVLSFALLASSCAAAPTTSDTTNPTTKPTTIPSSTVPPSTVPSSTEKKSGQFQIDVKPEQLNGFSIAGQRCVFLVTIENDADANAVEITASANDAEVFIDQKSIKKNLVAEVTVIPKPSSVGKSIEVVITGTRGEVVVKKSVSFEVIEGEDDRKEYAVELRDTFVDWLAKNKPELKLNSNTKWTGTMVSPQWLVVSHYLFFSDEWEMHVEWHIMIPPDDWARIDLRHRFDETKPSYAFEISSRKGNSVPKPIDVPEMIWR